MDLLTKIRCLVTLQKLCIEILSKHLNIPSNMIVYEWQKGNIKESEKIENSYYYSFHGKHCAFKDLQTGISTEICFGAYGHIDCFDLQSVMHFLNNLNLSEEISIENEFLLLVNNQKIRYVNKNIDAESENNNNLANLSIVEQIDLDFSRSFVISI